MNFKQLSLFFILLFSFIIEAKSHQAFPIYESTPGNFLPPKTYTFGEQGAECNINIDRYIIQEYDLQNFLDATSKEMRIETLKIDFRHILPEPIDPSSEPKQYHSHQKSNLLWSFISLDTMPHLKKLILNGQNKVYISLATLFNEISKNINYLELSGLGLRNEEIGYQDIANFIKDNNSVSYFSISEELNLPEDPFIRNLLNLPCMLNQEKNDYDLKNSLEGVKKIIEALKNKQNIKTFKCKIIPIYFMNPENFIKSKIWKIIQKNANRFKDTPVNDVIKEVILNIPTFEKVISEQIKLADAFIDCIAKNPHLENITFPVEIQGPCEMSFINSIDLTINALKSKYFLNGRYANQTTISPNVPQISQDAFQYFYLTQEELNKLNEEQRKEDAKKEIPIFIQNGFQKICEAIKSRTTPITINIILNVDDFAEPLDKIIEKANLNNYITPNFSISTSRSYIQLDTITLSYKP